MSTKQIRGWAFGLGSLASMILGIAMAYHGMNLNDGGDGPIGTPLVLWGAFFILVPVVTGIIWFLVAAGHAAAAEARRYKAWKATLTPEQRLAADAAEVAAIWGGAYLAHKGLEKLAQPTKGQINTKIGLDRGSELIRNLGR